MFTNPLFQSALTAFFGVLVFVIGQIIIKFFVEPIHKQAELIGEIAHSLTYYGNIYGIKVVFGDSPEAGSPIVQRAKDATNTFRDQGARLRATVTVIKWYPLWTFLRLVPKKDAVITASTELIGLSNSVGGTDVDWSAIHKREGSIAESLGFRIKTP